MDAILAFTLLIAPSMVSSLSPSLSTRGATSHAAVAAARGASSVPLLSTPIHARGGGLCLCQGRGLVGGGWMSPPTKTGSKGGRTSPSSPSFIPKNADIAQLYVFIDKSKVDLGRVSASKWFCLADKDFPYSHCKVPAHGKSSNGTKKFTPKVGAYYVLAGIIMGCPTAKMEPFIHLDNIPCHLLLQFEKGMMSAAGWGDLISEAVLYDAMDNYATTKKEDQAPGDNSLDGREFKDNSTIMSGMDEGYDDDVKINFGWDSPLEEYGGNAEWEPTTRAHRAALDLLAQALKTTSKTMGRDLKNFNRML
jgi:hypothetical protein